MTKEEKETFETMREVINKQSKAIKQLSEKLESMKHKVELNKQKIAGLVFKTENKKKNPLEGMFG